MLLTDRRPDISLLVRELRLPDTPGRWRELSPDVRDTKLSEDVLISLFMKELLRPLMGLSYIGPSKLVRLALDWKPDSGPGRKLLFFTLKLLFICLQWLDTELASSSGNRTLSCCIL